MTRVSLKEAYDNKDVVAQIYAIRDTAESAEDTAEQAVTTANTASEHVDALVPQVEGAVENANSASASAQASAQTVAGYENRLATVESDLGQTESDLSAVTLRVTTAEGDIVTIQGRVTALETADAQNVKINRINDYAVGLTGAQDVFGLKKHQFRPYVKPNTSKPLTATSSENQYVKLYDIASGGSPRVVHGLIKSLWFIQNRFEIEFWIGGFNSASTFSLTKSIGSNANLRVTRDSNNVWSIWFRYESNTSVNNRAFSEIIDQFYSYGYETDLITVINPADQVILGESSAEWSNYTIIENQEIA